MQGCHVTVHKSHDGAALAVAVWPGEADKTPVVASAAAGFLA